MGANMKLQSKRLEKGIEQADLAVRVGTNAPMMSNFERYKCIPIPTMLNDICKELECNIDDIYDNNEFYFPIRDNSLSSHKRIKKEQKIYYFSVRLPKEARDTFTQANLEKCGYHSLKDFAWHCWQGFEKQLSIINKKGIQETTIDNKEKSINR